MVQAAEPGGIENHLAVLIQEIRQNQRAIERLLEGRNKEDRDNIEKEHEE